MKSKTTTTSIILPVDLWKWWKSEADRTHRSKSAVVVALLEKLRKKEITL